MVRTNGVLLNPIGLPRAPSPSLLHVVIDPHCGCKALLPCLRRLIKQRAGVLSGLGSYTDGELANYFPHRLLLLPFFLFFRCFFWAGALSPSSFTECLFGGGCGTRDGGLAPTSS